jgi:uncharacterized RDD family membrane protein YckC
MASAYTPPGDPTEVLGRRAVALFIDAALLAVLGITLFALLRYRMYTNVTVDACAQLTKAGGQPLCLKLGSRVFLWHKGALKLSVLVVLFLGFLDGVVLQSITGSTVGKYCTRLSVVDEHGKQAHPLRMFGRWVMLVIDLGFLLVGCLITGATHPHRRLGDFVFGTYVVSRSSVGHPIADWVHGSAARGNAENAQPSFGEPATWTVPPVPLAAPALPVAAAPARPAPSAVLPVQTPPGTTPTSPGEWGAVARPAPLVRSPQWATPPSSDSSAPPPAGPAGPAPWAAPPAFREADASTDSDGELETETEAETDTKAEAEAETDIEAGADVEADTKPDAEPEPEAETEVEANGEAKGDAEADVDAEPEVELEADLVDEEEATSQWKPVESSSAKSRARTATGADDSWWDEALSSGDSETESDQ